MKFPWIPKRAKAPAPAPAIERYSESPAPVVPEESSRSRRPVHLYDYPYTYAVPQSPRRRPESYISIDDLRRVADIYDILRSCIQHLKREVAAVPLEIVAREADDDSADTRARVRAASDFFTQAGGLGGFDRTRRDYEGMLIEDLCVVGAAAVFYHPTRGNGLWQCYPVDAATIRPRRDAFGWPGPDQRVWEQWVQGVQWDGYTRSQMSYTGLNPVTWTPYYKSPVEWLVYTTTGALRADEWNRTWLTDGNMPSDLISTPEDWKPGDIKEYAEWWDALLSGDIKARRKTRFVPAGMQKQNATRVEMDFQEFELWLMRRTCSIMGVQPAAIGFAGEQYKVSQEEGMNQTSVFGAGQILEWRKEHYDDILLRTGFPDLETRNATDKAETDAEAAERLAKECGIPYKKLNEARKEMGLEPVPEGDVIYVPAGVLPLTDLVAQSEQATAQGEQQLESAEMGLTPGASSTPGEEGEGQGGGGDGPPGGGPPQGGGTFGERSDTAETSIERAAGKAQEGHWVSVDGNPVLIKAGMVNPQGAHPLRAKAQHAVHAKHAATAVALKQAQAKAGTQQEQFEALKSEHGPKPEKLAELSEKAKADAAAGKGAGGRGAEQAGQLKGAMDALHNQAGMLHAAGNVEGAKAMLKGAQSISAGHHYWSEVDKAHQGASQAEQEAHKLLAAAHPPPANLKLKAEKGFEHASQIGNPSPEQIQAARQVADQYAASAQKNTDKCVAAMKAGSTELAKTFANQAGEDTALHAYYSSYEKALHAHAHVTNLVQPTDQDKSDLPGTAKLMANATGAAAGVDHLNQSMASAGKSKESYQKAAKAMYEGDVEGAASHAAQAKAHGIQAGAHAQAHVLKQDAQKEAKQTADKAAQGAPATLKMEHLTKVGEKPGGSNPGFMAQDPNGQKWLVKTTKSPEHAKNEVLAGALYKHLGHQVPDLALVEDGEKTHVASKWKEGVQEAPGLKDGSYTQAHQGFVADAWLANWDAVGIDHTNIQTHNGQPVRIDVGGALEYRAQGAPKGAAFGNQVTELKSLLDPAKNKQAAAAFKGITPETIAQGAKELEGLTDQDVKDLVSAHGGSEELANKLIARKQDILQQVKALTPQAAPQPAAPQPAAAPAAHPMEGLATPEDHEVKQEQAAALADTQKPATTLSPHIPLEKAQQNAQAYHDKHHTALQTAKVHHDDGNLFLAKQAAATAHQAKLTAHYWDHYAANHPDAESQSASQGHPLDPHLTPSDVDLEESKQHGHDALQNDMEGTGPLPLSMAQNTADTWKQKAATHEANAKAAWAAEQDQAALAHAQKAKNAKILAHGHQAYVDAHPDTQKAQQPAAPQAPAPAAPATGAFGPNDHLQHLPPALHPHAAVTNDEHTAAKAAAGKLKATPQEAAAKVDYHLHHAKKDAKTASNHLAKGNSEKAAHFAGWVKTHTLKALAHQHLAGGAKPQAGGVTSPSPAPKAPGAPGSSPTPPHAVLAATGAKGVPHIDQKVLYAHPQPGAVNLYGAEKEAAHRAYVKKTYGAALASYTPEESTAATQYTASSFSLNPALRSAGGTVPDHYKSWVKNLDTAMEKSAVKEPLVVWRGESHHSSIDPVKWVGSEPFTHHEFGSWSTHTSTPENFASTGPVHVLRRITLQPGHKARPTAKGHAGYDDEREFIVARGTTVRTTHVETATVNGTLHYIVHQEIVGQK